MATSSTTPNWSHTSDATFRTWGSAFAAALLAVGLTKTSDTGQIDWVTVTRPVSVGDAGYEIWRFNDSAQSSAPIYMKIRYGTHTTTSSGRVQIDIGQGSDGAGNLTGVVQTSAFSPQNSSGVATTAPLYMVYNSTTGFFAFYAGMVSSGWRFCLERNKTLLGAGSTEAYFALNFTVTASAASQYVYRTGAGIWTSIAGTTQPHVVSTAGITGTGSAGGKAVAGGWVPWSGMSTHGPLEKTLGLMNVRQADWTPGQTYTCRRWDGVSHTYLVVPSSYGGVEQNGTVSYSAFLWE